MTKIRLSIILLFLSFFIIVAVVILNFWERPNADVVDTRTKSPQLVELAQGSDVKYADLEAEITETPQPIETSQDKDTTYADAYPISIILSIVLIALSFTTLISVGISFYLYRWRKILLANNNMIVPEEWAKTIQGVGKSLTSFGKGVSEHLSNVANETNNNTVKISNMIETYMQLQSALDEKDAEIKRLKTGYDAEIFRKFISRFIRIDQTIDDFINEDGETPDLLQLRRLFEDALDECGISKFSPIIGENYRSAKGVSDNPKTILTDDPTKEFLITEVIEAGYQLNNGQENNIIIPSKVKINKLVRGDP